MTRGDPGAAAHDRGERRLAEPNAGTTTVTSRSRVRPRRRAGMDGAGVDQAVDERGRGSVPAVDVVAGDDAVERLGARRRSGGTAAAASRRCTTSPRRRSTRSRRSSESRSSAGRSGGATRSTAATRSSASAARSAAPSRGVAPVGSPEHAVRADRARRRRRAAGAAARRAAPSRRRAARSRRTRSGRSASISDVSVRPAWASPPGSRGHHASTRRPSARSVCDGPSTASPVAAVAVDEHHAGAPSRPSGPARRAPCASTSVPIDSVPGEPGVLPAGRDGRPAGRRRRRPARRAARPSARARGDARVGVERQVRAVLLARPDGTRAAAPGSVDLGPGRARPSRHGLGSSAATGRTAVRSIGHVVTPVSEVPPTREGCERSGSAASAGAQRDGVSREPRRRRPVGERPDRSRRVAASAPPAPGRGRYGRTSGAASAGIGRARCTASIGASRPPAGARSDARRSRATAPSTDSTAGARTRAAPAGRRRAGAGPVADRRRPPSSTATRPRAWAAPSWAAR